ncbi:class I SAM-dependent methyltransferase [bacterium]|nr:class I SAM-dependent methyltransferase [bacterium]
MSFAKSAQFYDCFDTKDKVPFYVRVAAETTGDVLEFGVGTGRVLFEIAKLGRDAVGIDNSLEMLREAKRKRRTYFPELSGRTRFILADMLTLDLGRSFGFICAPSGGIQGTSPDDILGIFRRAAEHLNPGGIFAFDIMSPCYLKQTRVYSPERQELAGGRVVVRFIAQTYNEGDEAASIDLLFKEHIPGRTRYETYKESALAAIITPEMIRDALGHAELSLERIEGGFEGEEYTDESPRIIVTARKPG